MAKFIPPTKILFSGNTAACSEHIKFSLNQLAILERQMSFQGLNEGNRVVEPYEGVHVKCISSYSTHEIHIHVDQYGPTRKRGKFEFVPEFDREEEPEYEFPLKALFYVRIENSSYDRLVIYAMRFDGGSNLYNSSKNFSPGKGDVIADVDLTTNTLLYPIGLAPDTELALMNKVLEMLPRIPDRDDPYKGINNYAYDWYTFGPLTNRVKSAYSGEYTVADNDPDNPITLDLSESVTGLGGGIPDAEWWALTDPFDNTFDWLLIWSPKYGGDTRYLMDMYPLNDLVEAAQYYGEFTINTNGEVYEVADQYTFWPTDTYAQNDEDSIFRIYSKNLYLTSGELEDRYELIGGFFCTAIYEDSVIEDELDPARNRPPTFFIAHKGLPGGINQGAYASFIQPGGDWDYAAGLFASPQIDVVIDVDKIGYTITPLEILEPEDWLSFTDSESCAEFADTYWDTLPAVSGSILFYLHPSWTTDIEARRRIADIYGESVDDLMLNPDVLGYVRVDRRRIVKNATAGVEKTNIPSFFIMDEPEDSLNTDRQTKFCSLLYLDEVVVSGVSGAVLQSGYEHSLMCDYIEGDGKQTFYHSTGCIVYIFAPPEIYSESENGTLNYWDIHSARVPEGQINPYRCLDLEEYLMTVFTDISESIAADPETDKLLADPPRAHALSHYGFTVFGGFVASRGL